MNIKAQKGTKDILPEESETWRKIIHTAEEVFSSANVKEISTPIFEATELFQRGVGDSTDIVNKEMYSFEKSGRNITLRPENTAGVVRAYLEHNMQREISPVKLWYKGAMFRYERPQAGRQRQFHQIGMEMFGSKEPTADAECISIAVNFLEKLGLKDLCVELNSLGCDDCRNKLREKIKNFIEPHLENLCDDCKRRFETNPLRILDCKNETCIKIFEENGINSLFEDDFLCDECKTHFNKVTSILDKLNIKYTINRKLVRGLDYYTRTVFEVKSESLGSQSAILGGGRYDKLVEMLGGQPTPAVGFAVGVERLFSLIEKVPMKKLDYFIVSDNQEEALCLAVKIREFGKTADIDFSTRKFGKQMEKAAKLSDFAIILGENERNSKNLSIKNLATAEQILISEEEFFNSIKK